MTPASPADRPRTYGDLRRWSDDTRWEIIDGQAYAMAGPTWQHQAVTVGLSAQLLAYFRTRGCRVLPAPLDVRLPRGNEADDEVETTVQPDISVVCDPSNWLVHPIDRIVTMYRRQGQGGFGPSELFEARGVQQMEGFEGLEIDWDLAFADVPSLE